MPLCAMGRRRPTFATRRHTVVVLLSRPDMRACFRSHDLTPIDAPSEPITNLSGSARQDGIHRTAISVASIASSEASETLVGRMYAAGIVCALGRAHIHSRTRTRAVCARRSPIVDSWSWRRHLVRRGGIGRCPSQPGCQRRREQPGVPCSACTVPERRLEACRPP